MLALRVPILRALPPVPSRVALYKTTLTTTTNEDTTTWTGVDIGVPHPKRLIVLAAMGGANAAVTGTVNGYPAGAVFQGATTAWALLVFPVPVDTTATITVTTSGSARKTVGVYVLYPQNHIPLDWGSDSANTTTDANIANLQVQAGGCLIYAGGQVATLGTFTTTWNGVDAVTEDIDAQIEAFGSYTSGRIAVTESSSASDLNMAESVSGAKRLVAATWGPPPSGW